VSNANEDLPDPLTPETTVNSPIGRRTVTFLRVFCLAPSTRMNFFDLRIARFSRAACTRRCDKLQTPPQLRRRKDEVG